MYIIYEKMTEEDYLQLTLFRQNNEKKAAEFDMLVDISKINVPLSRVRKVSFHDAKKININFIQLKSELFQENLSYLLNLILILSKRKLVPDVNIRIYSHHYAYFQKEINSFLYCDTSGGFGHNDCHVNFRRVLMTNILRKVLGLRLTNIAYKIYRF